MEERMGTESRKVEGERKCVNVCEVVNGHGRKMELGGQRRSGGLWEGSQRTDGHRGQGLKMLKGGGAE